MRRTRSTPSISSSALVGPEVTCLALCRRSHVHDGMQCEDTMLRCSLIRQLQGMPQYLIVQQASGSDVHTIEAMQVEASVAMPWYFFQSQDAPNSSIPMSWPFPLCATCGVWCGVHRWCAHIWSGVWCGVVWCGVVWCGVVWCGVVCLARSCGCYIQPALCGTHWDCTSLLSCLRAPTSIHPLTVHGQAE